MDRHKKKKVMQGNYIIPLKRKVTPSGNSAHIVVGKEFLGCDAEIIIRKRWMICQRCSETFTQEKDFSKDPSYCSRCYAAIQFLKNKKGKLKCEKCSGPVTEEEYKHHWDTEICESCWIKEAEEFGKLKGGESVENYMD